ncbi:CoA-binding protein [Persephonella sp.]
MPVVDNEQELKEILQKSKNIAVIGISPNPAKPSYFVPEVAQRYGFKLFLVNPKYAGEEILGEKVYSSIKDIPEEIDIVDVFRRPSDIPEVAKEAREKGFKTFWFQPGTVNNDVVEELSGAGYNVVVDRCIKVECMRLLEE